MPVERRGNLFSRLKFLARVRPAAVLLARLLIFTGSVGGFYMRIAKLFLERFSKSTEIVGLSFGTLLSIEMRIFFVGSEIFSVNSSNFEGLLLSSTPNFFKVKYSLEFSVGYPQILNNLCN